MPWDNKYKPLPHQWVDPDSSSHYQTLTITRTNNNYDCAAEYTPDNLVDYSNTKLKHYDLQQTQQSSSSITGCSARSNSSGSSSGAGTGPSTSATTIGYSSLSSGNQCCSTSGNCTINGNCVNILPIVNHSSAAAALAALKQNECNGRSCGTLNRTSAANVDYNNRITAHNNGGMTLPHQSFGSSYGYQHHHHYPQFSPPAVPPPCVPMLKQSTRQDDSGMDSV